MIFEQFKDVWGLPGLKFGKIIIKIAKISPYNSEIGPSATVLEPGASGMAIEGSKIIKADIALCFLSILGC